MENTNIHLKKEEDIIIRGCTPKKEGSIMDTSRGIGIKVVANLPVGMNLQDHMGVSLEVTVQKISPIPINKVHTFDSLFEYLFTGKGVYSTPGFIIGAFYRVNSQPKEDLFPYIQNFVGIGSVSLTGKFQALEDSIRNGSIIPELVKEFQEEDEGFYKLRVPVVHVHPRSRGQITLRSTDPNDLPVIEHEYLDNEKDVSEIVQGIRMVQRLINSQVLQDAKVNPITGPDPNCLTQEYDSDAYWECYIRYNIASFIHYTSSCKMAPDSTGVVDNKLRVKGISGLRVVDASIMPQVPSANTQAPTIMIAEKAAEMILQANE